MSENRSTNWNVLLDAIAGNVPSGYCLIQNATKSAYVVATTANRVNWSGVVECISLSAGRSDQTVQAANIGHVPASTFGYAITGTGSYVNVQADGSLARAAAITADTVGDYLPTGDVRFFPGYQTGAGSGNATAIQGVTVSSAAATRSFVLAGNNTAVRMRAGTPNLLDDLPDGTNPATVTDWITYLESLATRTPAGGTCLIPYIGDIKISRPWRSWWDDTEHGNKHSITVVFEQGSPTGNTGTNQIVANFVDYTGNTASITAVGNGGSGQTMMTLSYTGLSAAQAADSAGEYITIWNSTNTADNVTTTVNKADADGTLYCYNPLGGAAADNGGTNSSGVAGAAGAGNGTIHFRVHRPAVDVRAAGMEFHGLSIRPGASGMLSVLLNCTQSTGALSKAVNQNRYYNTHLESTSQDALRWRYGIALAKSIVPLSTSPNYSVNGAGIPQTYHPGNVSEFLFWDTRFQLSVWGAGIAGYSQNGQSEQHLFIRSLPSFVRHLFTNPNIGVWSSSAHADFAWSTHGNVYDTIYNASPSARPISVFGDVGEPGNGARVANITPNAGNACLLLNNKYNLGTPHPSGEIIRIGNEGSITIRDNWLSNVSDSTNQHIYIIAGGSYGESHIDISNNLIRGTSAWVDGDPAELTATNRGPFVFADGDTLIFETAVGVPQTLTLTLAAINAANPGFTASREELRMFQLGNFIKANLTNGTAWGDEDDAKLTIRSTARGVAAWLKCNGGTFNTKLGLSTVGVNGTARKQINIETAGLVSANLSTPNVRMTWDNRHLSAATGNVVAMHSFHGRHMGTTKTGAQWAALKYGTVTHNAGGTTFRFTFATANLPDEPDTNIKVRPTVISVSAVVATGALQITAITPHATGSGTCDYIDFTVAADPATGNVTWGVEVFR